MLVGRADYIQAGEYEKAIDMLAPLLQVVASDLTLGWLNIDPTFVPLKGNPRLGRLLRSGA